ncbi:hypothetical protein AJ79_09432 [Helicocarpus griseus UAMH5409]|uniref:Uncharacterized protein n=1 Tax=Helicocarpus griseus UAMH5409 TaxID=1447875 RepID=A0A2B7WJP1_9EURO|nr:hypothetical protein AJ79_09432 [Helicocarpus griseus UAMH5409]
MAALISFVSAIAAVSVMAGPTPDDPPLGTRPDKIFICREGKNNGGKLIGNISRNKVTEYINNVGIPLDTASGFPKPFVNNMGLKFEIGCGEEVYQLPVLANGEPFDVNKKINQDTANENNPGRLRVFYDWGQNWSMWYCGIGVVPDDKDPGDVHLCTAEDDNF